MSNMKIVPLIAAEATERRLDIETVLHVIEDALADEVDKLNSKINALEERVDLLEHQ